MAKRILYSFIAFIVPLFFTWLLCAFLSSKFYPSEFSIPIKFVFMFGFFLSACFSAMVCYVLYVIDADCDLPVSGSPYELN